jgi:hypothetical protein
MKLVTNALSNKLLFCLLGVWLSSASAGSLDSFSPEAKEELAYATGIQLSPVACEQVPSHV